METLHTASLDQLLAGFPPVGKAQWLAQIEKDLKGRPIASLYPTTVEGATLDPFAHADDFTSPPLPLSGPGAGWEICEHIAVAAPADAQALALEALEGGAEGLCFQIGTPMSTADLTTMLTGIYPDFIGLHFEGPGVAQNPGAVLAALTQVAKERGLSTTALRGSLAYDPVAQAAHSTLPVDWRYLIDLISHTEAHFPSFRLIHLMAPAETGHDTAALHTLIQRAHAYFEALTARGLNPATVAMQLHFSLPIGTDYFEAIARIRAFKLLYLNLLNAWKAPLRPAPVAGYFQPGAYTDDLYTNMIRATTMAMSAALGGVDRLTVLPYDAGRETKATQSRAFARRMARNVQHLLKMESGLDQMADPAAGSYYIEKRSRELAAAAWNNFNL